MRAVRDSWQGAIAGVSEKRFSIGASVFRLVAGLTIVTGYVLDHEQRHYLFGPDGVWPWDMFAGGPGGGHGFSIYAWSQSTWYFEVCFHLGLLVAVLWFLGWRTRWTTVLNYAFWWSLQQRSPTLWDGGDGLLRVVLVYAMFADVSAHFSLDAIRRRHAPPRHPVLSRAGAMLHNAAMLAFAIQLSLVYLVAGLAMMHRHVSVVAGFDQATMLLLVSFPLLLFSHRYTRLLAVGLAVMFHAAIGLLLGMVTFSLFMTAVALSLVDDDEYRAMGQWLARCGKSVRGLRTPLESDDLSLEGTTVPGDWR